MGRMSSKYIQMYGLDIALNPIDGLGADIARGKTARCILVVVHVRGVHGVALMRSPGGTATVGGRARGLGGGWFFLPLGNNERSATSHEPV